MASSSFMHQVAHNNVDMDISDDEMNSDVEDQMKPEQQQQQLHFTFPVMLDIVGEDYF